MTITMPNDGTHLLPTRRSLLIRLKHADDQEGWQEFFHTYWSLIYGVARQAGLTDAEAQDAVQETVITVSRYIAEFQYDPARCSFKTWLLQITRQRISRQFAKREAMPAGKTRLASRSPAPCNLALVRFDDDTPHTSTINRIPDPAGPALEAVWDQEWEKHLLKMATERVKQQVTAEQYQMFDLYVLQGWSAREVSRTLAVGIGRVYLAKHRLAKLLKKEIARVNGTNS